MANLELRILGRFGVLFDGSPIVLPARVRELLSFLALQPGRSGFRHQVSGTLWPDMSDERASSNLSTCLWRLRRALGSRTDPELLVLSGNEIALGPGVRVDYVEFELFVTEVLGGRAELDVARRALDLWRGELLEGESETEWLLGERERIRLMHLRTLQAYADALVKHGRFGEALSSYERLIEMDPINEDACRRLMMLHHSRGNTTEALKEYSSFSKRLRAELGVSPEAQTKHIHNAIRQGRSLRLGGTTVAWSTAEQVDRQPPMVGRSAELHTLNDLLVQAKNGALVVAGIEGEAGIGKTRLAIEFARDALMRGCQVFRAGCDELPKASPYAPFRKLVRVSTLNHQGDRHDAENRLVFPDVSLVHPSPGPHNLRIASEDRILFLEAVGAWLQKEAQKCPSLLVIEDMHFADAASIDLLMYLAHEIQDCALMILMTWRADEHPVRVARIARPGGIVKRVLRLGRLAEDEVERVCRTFVDIGILGEKDVHNIYQASEGNPLFVIEMLKSFEVSHSTTAARNVNAGRSPDKRGAIRSGDYGLPPEIRQAVGKRFSRLYSDARRLLMFAAACGRRLDLELLTHATGFAQDELSRLLRTLCRFGFVSDSYSGFQFHHEKIREFCYGEIPTSVRTGLHRDVLTALERFWPDRLEERAFHSEHAGESRKAATYWETLGDRATAVWAHGDAIRAYTNAIHNLSRFEAPLEGMRYELLKKRAIAWELDGRIEKGADDIDEMSRIARRLRDELKRCETLTLQSRLLLRRGLFREAAATAREAVSIAHALVNPRLIALSKEILAFAYYRASRYTEARRMFHELIPLLEELKDNECLERVWNRLGSLEAAEGTSASMESLDKAEGYSQGDLNERGIRNLLRGQTYALRGRGEEARQFLQLAESDYRRARNTSGRALVNGMLALVFGFSGDFVSALVHARRGLPFRCGKSEAYWRVVSSTNLGHGVLLPLGNYSLAKSIVTKALRLLPQIAGRTKANLLDLAANVCLEAADFESAHDYAVHALEELRGIGDPFHGHYIATLGRVNLAIGETGRAADLLRTAVAELETETTQMELAQAYSWLSVAFRRMGLPNDALVASQKALRILDLSNGFAYRAQDILWNHFLALQARQDPRAAIILRKAFRVVMNRSAQLGSRTRLRYMTIQTNRDIVESYEKHLGSGGVPHNPRRVEMALGLGSRPLGRVSVFVPKTGASWGRPLLPDELVEVLLTVDSGPQDEALRQSKGDVGLRRARILRLCAEANVQGGDMREEDLARVLKVSTRTVRGDIAFLRSQGCFLHTRGATMH